MNFFNEEKIHVYLSYVIVFLLILLLILFFLILGKTKKEENVSSLDTSIIAKEEEGEEEKEEEPMKENVLDLVPASFKVDIKGAVKSPGVYEAQQGMVVQDIIALAGGLKSNASTQFINLAYKVSDQMVIRILTTTEVKELDNDLKETCVCPSVDTSSCDKESLLIIPEENTSKEENKNSEPSKEENTNKEESKSLVSINKATLEELMTLSGIGEAKAKAILAYREQNGPFQTLEDLKKVSGIGDAVYQKIKDSIQL